METFSETLVLWLLLLFLPLTFLVERWIWKKYGRKLQKVGWDTPKWRKVIGGLIMLFCFLPLSPFLVFFKIPRKTSFYWLILTVPILVIFIIFKFISPTRKRKTNKKKSLKLVSLNNISDLKVTKRKLNDSITIEQQKWEVVSLLELNNEERMRLEMRIFYNEKVM